MGSVLSFKDRGATNREVNDNYRYRIILVSLPLSTLTT